MTDIFIVSHKKDAVWLEYCLRSIDKFARAFRQTVVVFPNSDSEVLEPLVKSHPRTVTRGFNQGLDGHLDQNAIKTAPDTYTDADFFLHLDSDCVFTKDVTPLSFSTHGKPNIMWETYEHLRETFGNRGPVWQGVTEKALGMPLPVETMRSFPMLYPRWLYEVTRAQIESVHGTSFLNYVRGARPIRGELHGYCEFNALGGMAFLKYRDRFNWVRQSEAKDIGHLFPGVKQYWSHSGCTDEERKELDALTAGYNDPIPAPKTEGRLALVLQFWEGDKATTMRNARRIADNEPKFRKDVEFVFAARFDCPHDEETVSYVSKKFKVSKFTSTRRSNGWPAGCNDLWCDWVCAGAFPRVRSGEWADVKAMFTLEGDCIPVQQNWIQQLSKEWDRAAAEGKSIMGCLMPPPKFGPVGHINGNMLVAPDLFARFPKIISSKPDRGWDTDFAELFQPHWFPTPLITNYYHNTSVQEKDIRRVAPDGRTPALVHGVKDLSVEKYADRVLRKPKKSPAKIADTSG